MRHPGIVRWARTRLRQLSDSCDMGAVRFLSIAGYIREAGRALARIDAAWLDVEGDPNLAPQFIVAGSREVRDSLEDLMVIETDGAVLADLRSAAISVSTAIALLIGDMKREQRREEQAWADWRRKGGQ